jgi:hypothetical protein
LIFISAAPVQRGKNTRSERVETRKSNILGRYDSRLQAFLDFVLAQYVSQGVGELDQEKLGDLLQLKYHTVTDAADQLGGVGAARVRELAPQRTYATKEDSFDKTDSVPTSTARHKSTPALRHRNRKAAARLLRLVQDVARLPLQAVPPASRVLRRCQDLSHARDQRHAARRAVGRAAADDR